MKTQHYIGLKWSWHLTFKKCVLSLAKIKFSMLGGHCRCEIWLIRFKCYNIVCKFKGQLLFEEDSGFFRYKKISIFFCEFKTLHDKKKSTSISFYLSKVGRKKNYAMRVFVWDVNYHNFLVLIDLKPRKKIYINQIKLFFSNNGDRVLIHH